MTDTESIRLMMQRAFEQAFAQQIMSLYKVFLSNTSSVTAAQRQHTAKGIEHAVEAYRLAIEAVGNWKG